jgi:very-short-patch-repair endonuclease
MKQIIKQAVRKLRREQTNAELILWQAIRNRKPCGKKFLRQHPIIFEWNHRKRFLIADFYCYEAGVVIEVDGGVHEGQKDYDEAREYALKCLGLTILRFKNKEIVKDVEGVIKKLTCFLKSNSPSVSLS